MELDVWDVVVKGFQKTFENSGVTLAAVFFVIDLIGQIAGISFRSYLLEAGVINAEGASGALQYAWIGSPVISGILIILAVIASLVTAIVTIRVFLQDKIHTIPEHFYKENLFNPSINLIIGGILYSVLILVGLFLLVLPGIYLFLALFFWTIIVVDKNVGFFDAMKKSWNITKGTKTKFSIFLLAIVLAIIAFLVALIGGFLVGVFGIADTFVRVIVEIIITSLLSVFNIGVVVEAYKREIHRQHRSTVQNT